LNSTVAKVATKLVYTTADRLSKSNNTSVNTSKKLYNTILNLDKELDSIVVKFRRLDNNTINIVKQLNTTTQEALIKLDNAID